MSSGELVRWDTIKNSGWVLRLVSKALRNYWASSDIEHFRKKYPGKDTDFIVRKLTSAAARNAAILGVIIGATVSTDAAASVLSVFVAEITLPATIIIALAAAATEATLLVRFQLKLICCIAKAHDIVLDPEDPEDVLTVLAYTFGGSAARAAREARLNVGGSVTRKVIRKYVNKQVSKMIRKVGRQMGLKVLQRTIFKYAIPVVAIFLGMLQNYRSTKAAGRLAHRHFSARRAELNSVLVQ